MDAHDEEFYDENCLKSADGQHCNCWYDDELCHYCQVKEKEKDARTEDIVCVREGSKEL